MHGYGRIIALAVLTWSAGTALLLAQEVEDEVLVAAIAELRGGAWAEAPLTDVVTGLVERGQVLAAGFWLAEADDALARGDLGKGAKGTVAKLRKSWTKAIPADAKSLVRDLLGHAEALARAKAFTSAREFSSRAEAALALWPDSAGERRLERVAKKAADGDDAGVAISSSLRRVQEALDAEWARAFESWLALGSAEFDAFGTPAGYQRLLRLSGRRAAGHPERSKRLREACAKAGLTEVLVRPARLWVTSFKDVDVWIDGEKVAEQPGAMTVLTSRLSGAPVEFRRIDFELWRGSRVVLTLRDPSNFNTPGGLPSFGPTSNHAICVRLEVGGAVPATTWRTGNGEKPEDVTTGPLVPAVPGVVGPLTGRTRSGPVGAASLRAATKEVTFRAQKPDTSSELVIPVDPLAEDFFLAEKIEGTWLTGFEPRTVYLVDL